MEAWNSEKNGQILNVIQLLFLIGIQTVPVMTVIHEGKMKGKWTTTGPDRMSRPTGQYLCLVTSSHVSDHMAAVLCEAFDGFSSVVHHAGMVREVRP
jgi:hypothetical protein